MVNTLIGRFHQVFHHDPILREIRDPGAERQPDRRLAGDRLRLQTLQQASFDPSALQIDIMGQTEAYVMDEPKDFLKISAHGALVIKTAGKSENIQVNDTIILEKIGDTWKVTEKFNPFS